MCIFTPRLSAPRSILVAVLFVSDAILPVPRVCRNILANRIYYFTIISKGLRTLSLGLIVSEQSSRALLLDSFIFRKVSLASLCCVHLR